MSKIVLASGVFDILHPGHIYYLTEAKKLGDPTSPSLRQGYGRQARLRGASRLVVIITSDETARLQGKQPIFCERHRAEIVSHLKMVDEVVIGRSGKDYESVIDVWPDVIAIGWDQCQNIKYQISNIKKNPNSKSQNLKQLDIGDWRFVDDFRLEIGDSTRVSDDVLEDAGIQKLKTELKKYHWPGQIVRIGQLPEQAVSSSAIKDGIVNSLSQMSKLKTQIYPLRQSDSEASNSKLKTEARSFKI